MENFESYLKNPIFDIIKEAVAKYNTKAYVIGGFVRDLILERNSKDIDIVIENSGIEIASYIAKKHNLKLSIFKNFGTAMIKFPFQNEIWEIEFVGARKESYRKNSRKPLVEDGSLQDDQNRRDFTINALAISLNKDSYGEIIDPFGGLQDIKNKRIITPLEPNKTYSDDPLRMMRAIRFATQLHFYIEGNSLQAISDNKERIRIISKERITDELNKIIMSEIPSKGFQLLSKTGLLEIIFPEFEKLRGKETINGISHKDNYYHTLEVLDNIAKNTQNIWLRWAAILHDIAKPVTKKFVEGSGWTFHAHEYIGARMVPKIFKKLKLPLNEKMKFVQKMVKLHLRPIALVKEEVSDSAIRRLLFEAGDDIDELMILCHSDITSKNDRKVKQYYKNFKIVEDKLIEVEEKDKLRNWQPPISGKVIMDTFDIKPGPEVGKIKNAIKEAILDGNLDNNYKDAFDFMLNKGKELGLEKLKK